MFVSECFWKQEMWVINQVNDWRASVLVCNERRSLTRKEPLFLLKLKTIPKQNWFAKLQKHARSKCAVFAPLLRAGFRKIAEHARRKCAVFAPLLRAGFRKTAETRTKEVCRVCALTSCGLPQCFRKPFSVWYKSVCYIAKNAMFASGDACAPVIINYQSFEKPAKIRLIRLIRVLFLWNWNLILDFFENIQSKTVVIKYVRPFQPETSELKPIFHEIFIFILRRCL
jgi:hypothetical protein